MATTSLFQILRSTTEPSRIGKGIDFIGWHLKDVEYEVATQSVLCHLIKSGERPIFLKMLNFHRPIDLHYAVLSIIDRREAELREYTSYQGQGYY